MNTQPDFFDIAGGFEEPEQREPVIGLQTSSSFDAFNSPQTRETVTGLQTSNSFDAFNSLGQNS